MFPTGNRRSGLRQLRYGAIAILLVASVVFHGTGPVYSAIRFGYLVVVVALIASRFRQRGPGVGSFRTCSGGAPVGSGTARFRRFLAVPVVPDPDRSGRRALLGRLRVDATPPIRRKQVGRRACAAGSMMSPRSSFT